MTMEPLESLARRLLKYGDYTHDSRSWTDVWWAADHPFPSQSSFISIPLLILTWREADDRFEIIDQMRLVEIPQVEGHLRPIEWAGGICLFD